MSLSYKRACERGIPGGLGDRLLTEKAERLASTEISFIDHPDFRRRTAKDWYRDDVAEPIVTIKPATGTGVAFLPELVRTGLLRPDQERQCFLQMNYHRYRAERLRRKLRPRQPDPELIAEIEAHLETAGRIRNWIAKANVRLLVATAKRLSHSLDQLADLVSEGLLPLLRAVDLFDAGRGHRFSTYATWAVRNQMIRMLRRQRTQPQLALTDDQASWSDIPDHRSTITEESIPQDRRDDLIRRMLASLPEREQQIVRARFGLDGEPAGQSLAQISSTMGLSKERIRQIVLQALEKLRTEAAAVGLRAEDELVVAT
ncbi:MAG TPA: sigma-70 family RNA polymerase sigma factor [Planctomycetaceae bacterium]|nr:sigma-70 family RNA polymerase sigma factor [Planctomycetaceae bacterium]